MVYNTFVIGKTTINDNTIIASKMSNACDVFISLYFEIIRAMTDVPPNVLWAVMTKPEPIPNIKPAKIELIKLSWIPNPNVCVKSRKIELAVIVIAV